MSGRIEALKFIGKAGHITYITQVFDLFDSIFTTQEMIDLIFKKDAKKQGNRWKSASTAESRKLIGLLYLAGKRLGEVERLVSIGRKKS